MSCRYGGKEIEAEDRFCPRCGKRQIDIAAEGPIYFDSVQMPPVDSEAVFSFVRQKRTPGIFAMAMSLCWMADLLSYFIWSTNLWLITIKFFLTFVFVILSILLLTVREA